MFHHRNPYGNEDDYNYLSRCVERFRILLTKPEHKLFIITIVNGEYNSLSDRDGFISSINNLNNMLLNRTNNYTLLVIINHSEHSHNDHTFTYNENIHILDLYTLSKSQGTEFWSDNDNNYLDNIINSNYHFTISKL